ncbi:hypothetical protein RB653_004317 [Dictyostelium firmibasis]|uniref:Uncharacterized protein n=1 Tax=Dictyostelium firmibasis TaxID=79012 RepID=A0AAN7U644_9MYCE
MGIFDVGDRIVDEIKKLSEIIQPPIKNSNKAIDSYKELAILSQKVVESTLKPYKEFGEQLTFYSSIIFPLIVAVLVLISLCILKYFLSSTNNKNNKIKSN